MDSKELFYKIGHALGTMAIGAAKAMRAVLEGSKDSMKSLGEMLLPGDLVKGFKETRENLMTEGEKFKKEVKKQKIILEAQDKAKELLGLN
jgi:hypothetical protein